MNINKRKLSLIEDFDEEDLKDDRNKDNYWLETSKWTTYQLDILRIIYRSVDFETIFGMEKIVWENIKLENRELLILIEGVNEERDLYLEEKIKTLPYESKIIVNDMKQIIKNQGKEGYGDQLINDIFYNFKFRIEGLYTEPKPKFKFIVGSKEIVSESDIGVYFISKNKENVFLLFNESKSSTSPKDEKDECQMAGEFIATGNKNLDSEFEGKIYGIRMKVLEVTIYSCNVTKKYIKEIMKNVIPSEELCINKSKKLNMLIEKERIIFYKCLNIIEKHIRKEMEKREEKYK